MKYLMPLFSSLLFSCLLSANPLNLKIESILNDSALTPYHGWVRYLEFRCENACAKLGEDSEEALLWNRQLTDWVDRIQNDPKLIDSLQGVFEWAYESQADLSGQPFKIAIPIDYDPDKSYGINLYMHGYSGNHMEHATGMECSEDFFKLSILGRARGGFYENLSEVDVLDALKYVQKHWSIDPQRIHFSGGSMGGWATFALSNRYPHLVASARPTCGFGVDLPIGNWMHIPFYSIHSKDDYVVPVVHSRVPLQSLQQAGGKVIIDETDGLGHASWDYVEGNARADEWFSQYRAPLMSEVKNIDYTAIDGKVRKGYWAEIEEWGADQKPARFQLSVSDCNALYATLTNVGVLRVDLADGPFDLSGDLMLSINGQIPQHFEAPLPASLYLVGNDKDYSAQKDEPQWPEYRLRYPGSARNLYSGEPLLIVWGTQGTDAENLRIAKAAYSARRSQHPYFSEDEGDEGPDGVIHEHNTYGLLAGKPDTEVTEEDIQRCHLVLIGNARQNLIARRIANDLPVTIESGQVLASDGISWVTNSAATLITHYNPLAPKRLIFWIGCDDVDFYTQGNALIKSVHSHGRVSFNGTDVVVYDCDTRQLIGARNFGTRWQWNSDYMDSPLLPESFASYQGEARMHANIMIEAVGADFSFVSWPVSDSPLRYAVGKTRIIDLAPAFYGRKLVVMEMSGREIVRYQTVLMDMEVTDQKYAVLARENLINESIDLEKKYQVVTNLFLFSGIMADIKKAPEHLRYSGLSFQDAFDLYLDRHF